MGRKTLGGFRPQGHLPVLISIGSEPLFEDPGSNEYAFLCRSFACLLGALVKVPTWGLPPPRPPLPYLEAFAPQTPRWGLRPGPPRLKNRRFTAGPSIMHDKAKRRHSSPNKSDCEGGAASGRAGLRTHGARAPKVSIFSSVAILAQAILAQGSSSFLRLAPR